MSIGYMPLSLLLLIAAGLVACEKVEPPQIQKVTYADDVSPIMQKHCADCHVAGRQGAEASGLLLDSYESVMKGSRFGPVVDPGSPMTSSLYILITGKARLTITMPHGKDALDAEEIETIRLWIVDGAVEN